MNDFKFAFRQLLKNPVFTAVAAGTLALGIGANAAIFSVVNGVLLKPLPFPEPERLVTLWERNPRRGIEQEPVSPPNLADWKEQNNVFEDLAFWTEAEVNLMTTNGTQKVRRAHVSASFFTLLEAKPLLGRVLLPDEDQVQGNRAAVLSYELWQVRFLGDPNVLGQTLTVDTYGRRDYVIVGVMPPGFQFPGRCELWLPAGWNGLPRDRRTGHWLSVLGRLKPEVSLAQARVEMNTIQARLKQQHPEALIGSEVALVPLLEQTLGRNLKPALWVLWGVVAGVLLIACANVANLLLARAAHRQKEIALRAALGATRWRVIRQLLSESLLLSLFGGGVGVLLGWWGLQLLVAASPGDIPRLHGVRLDASALAFTLVLSALTAILFGLAPAWQFSRPNLDAMLKDASRGTSAGLRSTRARNVLVVAELALSLTLLIAAGLMMQSFLRLARTDRGFNPEHLLVAELDFSVSGFTTWVRPDSTRPQVGLKEVLEQLHNRPGVQAVGAISGLPRRSSGVPVQTILFAGRPPPRPEELPTADFAGVTPDFFRALGMTLLRGRSFTEADHLEAPPVLIINETLAKRYFPNEDPLGKRLSMSGRNPTQPGNTNSPSAWPEVVGVVADMKNISLNPKTDPRIYVPYWQWPMQSPTVVVRTAGDAKALSAAIRAQVKTSIPSLPPPMIRTMEDILHDTMAQPRFQTWLLALFGILALVLASVGLYGVLAYTVAQRTPEIGIRLALGAQKRSVLALVIGQGMKLALAGVGIGMVAALGLTRVLRNLLYQVTPTDPLTFAGVALLLVATALLACWLPARRASRVQPIEALRYE